MQSLQGAGPQQCTFEILKNEIDDSDGQQSCGTPRRGRGRHFRGVKSKNAAVQGQIFIKSRGIFDGPERNIQSCFELLS